LGLVRKRRNCGRLRVRVFQWHGIHGDTDGARVGCSSSCSLDWPFLWGLTWERDFSHVRTAGKSQKYVASGPGSDATLMAVVALWEHHVGTEVRTVPYGIKSIRYSRRQNISCMEKATATDRPPLGHSTREPFAWMGLWNGFNFCSTVAVS
jgi:hypothetical protein